MKKTFLLLLFALGISVWGWGQQSISIAGAATTQDFSGMGTSSTATLPTGFKIGTDWSSGTTATTQAYGTTGTGVVTGSSAGGTVNWANGVTGSSTERALGFLSSSGYTSPRSIIYAFTNNTGNTITSIDLDWNYEKYRSGSRAFSWTFFHGSTSTAATSATSGDQNYPADANNTVVSNPPLNVNKSFSITGLSIANGSTYYLRWTYTGTGGSTNAQGLAIDDFSITLNAESSTPSISVTPPTLSDFTYVQGFGPSTEQTFTVSGSNLTADISIAASTNYEISETSGSGYTSPITLTQSGGSVGNTTIYVRLMAGRSAGSYNGEEITASSTGADNKTVSCSGSVSPPPDPEPTNHATDFTATTNSHNQITLTWTDATGTQLPHAYLVKAAVSPATPTAPTDGVAEGDGTLVKNIEQGTQNAVFTGLEPGTTYNFAIWPYTNSGADIDYKTDGTVPNDDGTTLSLPKVFISEYIEGTSNNKAIEIFNGEGTNLDLNKLTVKLYANGSTSPSNTFTGSAGSFNANSAYVIANSLANAEILGIADVTNAVANYNGNDAIEVVYDGATTDILGVIGNNPGTGWAVAGTANATADKTLLRKLTVTQGTSNWTTSAGTDANNSQWIIKDADYAKNLGGFATAWLGTLDEEWTTETNWDIEAPASNTNVLINNVTNSPSISAFTEIKALHLKTGSSLTIESDGSLTVNGTLTNNGSLTIKSDATGTGSLIHYTAGVNATVERYLSGSSEAWHLLSTPVTGQAISGTWTPAGSYPDFSGYDIYVYDEASNTYVNRKNTIANPIGDGPRFDDESINGGLNFVTGKGYMVAFEAVGSTKSFTGTLNEGIIYMPLLSKVGTSIYAGSNLVGNPYPSSIDWKSLMGVDFTGVRTETGGGKQFYIWNQTANNFGVYNSENAGDDGTNGASRYIAPMQGFWVAAATNGGELGFDNDARVHSSQAWLKASTATNPSLVIRATAPETIGYDEIILEFGHESSIGGASKKFSFVTTAPSLYMEKGTEKFSISYLTDVTSNPEIPLAFKPGTNGVYTLSVPSGLEAFERVTLHDLAIGVTRELKQNPVYTFTAAEGDAPNRFKLTFGSVGIETPAVKPIAAYYAAGRLYFVNAQAEKTIEVFNMAGQRLIFAKTTANEYPVNLSAGMYVVKVSTAQQLVSAKFFVK